MRRHPRHIVVACAVALAPVIAGCSTVGSQGTSTGVTSTQPATPPPTAAAMSARATEPSVGPIDGTTSTAPTLELAPDFHEEWATTCAGRIIDDIATVDERLNSDSSTLSMRLGMLAESFQCLEEAGVPAGLQESDYVARLRTLASFSERASETWPDDQMEAAATYGAVRLNTQTVLDMLNDAAGTDFTLGPPPAIIADATVPTTPSTVPARPEAQSVTTDDSDTTTSGGSTPDDSARATSGPTAVDTATSERTIVDTVTTPPTTPSPDGEAEVDRQGIDTCVKRVQEDITTIDERLGDGIGVAMPMSMLSDSYECLEDVGVPPGQPATDYLALVRTLAKFAQKASDIWYDDEIESAAIYTTVRGRTQELFDMINTRMGTSYKVP